jgi:hypothetical protein
MISARRPLLVKIGTVDWHRLSRLNRSVATQPPDQASGPEPSAQLEGVATWRMMRPAETDTLPAPPIRRLRPLVHLSQELVRESESNAKSGARRLNLAATQGPRKCRARLEESLHAAVAKLWSKCHQMNVKRKERPWGVKTNMRPKPCRRGSDDAEPPSSLRPVR